MAAGRLGKECCARSKALAYQADEVRSEFVLCDAIPRARVQRQLACRVPFIRVQSENTDGRIDFAYFPNRTDSTLFWKIQVHKNYARSVLAKQTHSLASGHGSPNDFHARLKTDKSAKAIEQEWIMLDYQNPTIRLFHPPHYLRCDALGEILKLADQEHLIWGVMD